MTLGFDMHLADKRAGRIEKEHIACLGIGRNAFGDAMRRKHHRRFCCWDFFEFLDENGAFGLQAFNDILVVNDGMAHINRCAIFLQRQFHNLDGAINARAKTARGAKHDVEVWPFFHERSDAFRAPSSQVLLQRGGGVRQYGSVVLLGTGIR